MVTTMVAGSASICGTARVIAMPVSERQETQTCPLCNQEQTNHDVIGVEIRGAYDGVLFWVCKLCSGAYPRVFGYPTMDAASIREAEAWNDDDPQ